MGRPCTNKMLGNSEETSDYIVATSDQKSKVNGRHRINTRHLKLQVKE